MMSPALRVFTAADEVYDDPSWETLANVLSEMNLRFRFVILRRFGREPSGQHYIQVYLNDDMSCQVEYREGGPDRHYQAHVAPMHELLRFDDIAALMSDWAYDRPGWREAMEWTPKPIA
ncbi:hypothetical protein [Streptomyces sp. YIM S03343]